MRDEQTRAEVDRRRSKDGLGVVESPAPSHLLGSLSGNRKTARRVNSFPGPSVSPSARRRAKFPDGTRPCRPQRNQPSIREETSSRVPGVGGVREFDVRCCQCRPVRAAFPAPPRSWRTERERGGASAPVHGRRRFLDTTCAFVPPIPNELTPARRGPPLPGFQRSVTVLTKNGLVAKSISGFGAFKVQPRRNRSVPQRQHRLDQSGHPGRRVEMPDVRLDRPERAEARASRPPRKTPSAPRPRSDRPAACPCRAPRRRRSCPGRTPATACASAITADWPSTLGAVKPTFSAPSLLIAEPRITAWIVIPLRQRVLEPLEHDDAGAARRRRSPRRRRRTAGSARPARGSSGLMQVSVTAAGRTWRRRRRAPCRIRMQSRPGRPCARRRATWSTRLYRPGSGRAGSSL